MKGRMDIYVAPKHLHSHRFSLTLPRAAVPYPVIHGSHTFAAPCMAAAGKKASACTAVQDTAVALRVYTAALSLWMWFDRGADRASEDIPWTDSLAQLPEGPEKEEVGPCNCY